MSKKVLMKIEHLHKTFGITHANNDICTEIYEGEIRSLSGENGSGKSTLTSILAGLQPYDDREDTRITLDGAVYKPNSPLDANAQHVAMVVQEIGVVTNLTGAMNIFLGQTKQFTKFGVLMNRKLNKAAQDIFDKWELPKVPLNIACSALTMEQRKIIELARALNTDPKLLVLDEITQSLSIDTRKYIYKLKDRFKKEGRSIVIISHDLEETMEISDTISILRDGVLVETVEAKGITIDDLKQKMVGRKIDNTYVRTDKDLFVDTEELLRVEDLSLANKDFTNINLTLHKGEILALCGLSDGGIHQLGSAIFGISTSARSGRVLDVQKNVEIRSPGDMLKCKGAYLSKNRDEEGLMMNAEIKHNLTLPSEKKLALPNKSFGYIKEPYVKKLANKIYKGFDVKANGIGQPIGRLSGGNKQKINLGRWLEQDLDYVILDCPTRGVDIGVKAYIYDVMKKKKASGVGIVLITDELSEAIGMADRIAVLKEGKLQKIFERPDFSEGKIVEVML